MAAKLLGRFSTPSGQKWINAALKSQGLVNLADYFACLDNVYVMKDNTTWSVEDMQRH